MGYPRLRAVLLIAVIGIGLLAVTSRPPVSDPVSPTSSASAAPTARRETAPPPPAETVLHAAAPGAAAASPDADLFLFVRRTIDEVARRRAEAGLPQLRETPGVAPAVAASLAGAQAMPDAVRTEYDAVVDEVTWAVAWAVFALPPSARARDLPPTPFLGAHRRAVEDPDLREVSVTALRTDAGRFYLVVAVR